VTEEFKDLQEKGVLGCIAVSPWVSPISCNSEKGGRKALHVCGPRAGPSGPRAGPSGPRAGPSGPRAGPSGQKYNHRLISHIERYNLIMLPV